MRRTIGIGLTLLALAGVVALFRVPRGAAWVRKEPRGLMPEEQGHPHQDLAARFAGFPGQSKPAGAPELISLAWIEAQLEKERRSEDLGGAVHSMADADIRSTLDWLVSDERPEAVELRALLIRKWAESSPPSASAWASALPEGGVRRGALEQVAVVWADHDLAGATAWAQSLAKGGDGTGAVLSVAYEAARSDPVAALDLASSLPATEERADLLVHAISQWSSTDPSTAATWALEVSDPNLRARLLSTVAIASAEQDAPAAATLALNSLEPGAELDRTIVSIVQRWAQQAPEAAAAWVAQFPDIPSRGPAVQGLLSIWIGRDAKGADLWVRRLPGGNLSTLSNTIYAQILADQGFGVPPSTPSAEQ